MYTYVYIVLSNNSELKLLFIFLISIIYLLFLPIIMYISYKYGRKVEKIINNQENSETYRESFIKDEKCEHDWKVFNSGYKQCKKCRSIVKVS